MELPLIPLEAGTKIPIKGLDLEVILHGRASVEDTRRYFEEKPELNYAIPCLNGYFALDFDSLENYLEFFPKNAKLEASTMCVQSPHHGMHVWFKTAEAVPRKIRFSDSLDILGVGGYAVAPGSVIDHTLCDPKKTTCPHSGRGTYEVVESFEIIAAEALLPGTRVLDAIAKRAESLGWKVSRRSPRVKDIAAGVNEGARNDAAFTMARFLLFEMKMDSSDAMSALEVWNSNNKPPLGASELRSVLMSARNYAPRSPIKEGATWRG